MTAIMVGGTETDEFRLSARVRNFGPQVIVVNGQVFELLTQVGEPENAYLALSPHNIGLYVVEPFARRSQLVDPATWRGWGLVSVGRVNAAQIVQYTAEAGIGDIEKIDDAARTFATMIVATRADSNEGVSRGLVEMMRQYQLLGHEAVQLANALVRPDMMSPTDPVGAMTDVITLLAKHVALMGA